ncbi:TIGR03987 family protein [Gordonibacter sp. An230]|uniref:HsmA family protein n=1 Tax=Gordonibacter sp. An230 TaxID=1965592 RepID=UPI000B3AF033|nr:HsmA family protein [Gordonibacter sp. An230]OUO90175.1 TIGR03987 family protein [Gordonibacter sp. An230]
MSAELVIASVAITCALVLYTVGVFGERRSGTLSVRHVLLFWGGLACDTTGTMIMTGIAQQSEAGGFGIHGITGLLAIVLMLVHAGWATVTLVRRNERSMRRFHAFSTFVWLAWLVPYIIGMLVGMPMIHLRAVCAVGTSVIVVAALAFVMFRGEGGCAPSAR